MDLPQLLGLSLDDTHFFQAYNLWLFDMKFAHIEKHECV